MIHADTCIKGRTGEEDQSSAGLTNREEDSLVKQYGVHASMPRPLHLILASRESEGKSVSCSSGREPADSKDGVVGLQSPRSVISPARVSMLTALLG
jgi:hypothetical protein